MTSRTDHLLDDIAAFLEPFQKGDQRLGVLLSYSVGRVLLNAGRRGEDWRSIAEAVDIGHIRDWISAALVNDSPWLRNVDDKGRPKKLLKGGTLDTFTAEADKAMLATARELKDIRIADGDEALYAMLDGGYYVVRLLTPVALDRESSQMQHCIGEGAYDSQVSGDDHLYLSLRSPNGKPHATLEVEHGSIVQMSGKQNRTPIKQYLDLLIPFMKSSGFKIGISSWTLGHVVDENGKWHDVLHLPEGLATQGEILLGKGFDKPLPNGLVVNGHLNIGATALRTLPAGLVVRGDLVLPMELEELPERLVVEGDVYVRGLQKLEWPVDYKIGGSVYFHGGTKVKLPENFQVGGNLGLGHADLVTLPAGLRVGGNLALERTPITSLPVGLHVGGNLDVDDTPLTSFPSGLRVGGNLYALNSAIETFADDIKVGGSIDLRNTPLLKLPEKLEIDGDLLLSGSKLTSLPQRLSVSGKLEIRGLSISELPEGITVGEISLLGARITSLPESIPGDTPVYDEDGETTAAAFRAKHQAGYVRPVFQYVR